MRGIFLMCAILLSGCGGDDSGDLQQQELITQDGFWRVEESTGLDELRVLMYQGEVFAVDKNQGYYGTYYFDERTRMADVELQSYLLNSGYSAEQGLVLADSPDAKYQWLLQETSLTHEQDTLIGPFNVDGVAEGNLVLVRDEAWVQNSDLQRLRVKGFWTSSNYRLGFSALTEQALKFTLIVQNASTGSGSASAHAGCALNGEIRSMNTRYNLFRVTNVKRTGCAEADLSTMRGFAGFNKEGELEFYLHNNTPAALLFFTLTPPSGNAVETPPSDELPDTGVFPDIDAP